MLSVLPGPSQASRSSRSSGATKLRKTKRTDGIRAAQRSRNSVVVLSKRIVVPVPQDDRRSVRQAENSAFSCPRLLAILDPDWGIESKLRPSPQQVLSFLRQRMGILIGKVKPHLLGTPDDIPVFVV